MTKARDAVLLSYSGVFWLIASDEIHAIRAATFDSGHGGTDAEEGKLSPGLWSMWSTVPANRTDAIRHSGATRLRPGQPG